MQKPRNWENTPAQMGGQHEMLPAGGHIMKILRAEVRQNKNGADMLVLTMDVAEGTQYDGFFRREYNARNMTDKWPVGGMMYQSLTDQNGDANPRFKGLIKAIEQSNLNYAWNWDELTLKGKLIGIIYREEDREYQGRVYTDTKPMACCAAGDALDKEAPRRKELDRTATPTSAATTNSGFTQVDDDELPF